MSTPNIDVRVKTGTELDQLIQNLKIDADVVTLSFKSGDRVVSIPVSRDSITKAVEQKESDVKPVALTLGDELRAKYESTSRVDKYEQIKKNIDTKIRSKTLDCSEFSNCLNNRVELVWDEFLRFGSSLYSCFPLVIDAKGNIQPEFETDVLVPLGLKATAFKRDTIVAFDGLRFSW